MGILTIWLVLGLFKSDPCGAIVSKEQAFHLLQQNGYKWQQTSLLVQEAKAKTIQARSILRPHIDAYSREYLGRVNQIQYGFQDPGNLTWFEAGTSGIQIGYDFFDLSSVSRLNAAHENEKMAAANSRDHQLTLTYIMLFQYLNAQRLKKNMEIADQNIERDLEIFEAARKKVMAGAGVALDVERADGIVEHGRFKRLDVKTSWSKACRELATTLGTSSFECDLEPFESHPLKQSMDLLRLREKLVQRPDLASARAVVDASERLKEMVARETIPKLSLFGDVGMFGAHFYGGAGTAISGAMGVQLTFPIFTGGLHGGRIQEEEIKLASAQLQERQLTLESKAQLDESIDQLKDAEQAIDLAKKEMGIAQKELQYAKKRFFSGFTGGLDLTNAQINISNANESFLQATFGYEVAKLNLFKAIGNFEEYFAVEAKK